MGTINTLADLNTSNQATIASWQNFLDLAIPVTIELGRTKMTVQEILGLGLHQVVQLNRSTGEGIDIFASDRCFARGEIIMIGDRTSIRINEILTSQYTQKDPL